MITVIKKGMKDRKIGIKSIGNCLTKCQVDIQLKQ